MIKKLLLITVLLVLHFRNIVAMHEMTRAFSNHIDSCLTQPMDRWKKLSPLTQKEMRIYNKTWNYKFTLTRNKSDLADMFCDICCDFSFKITRKAEDVVFGRSIVNPNIIFIDNIDAVNSFIRKDLKKYAITNFLDHVGHPRPFTFEMREQLRKQIRIIAEDVVGCKLLRIATAKIAVGSLPKLIFIPLEKNSIATMEDGMNIYSGIYGWKIESDRFLSKIKIARTMHERMEEFNNRLLDFQKYSQMNLQKYNYILFSPEDFDDRPIVGAIKNIGTEFKFFRVQFPTDATVFRTIVRALGGRKSDSCMNIKARLNLKKKKFSQKLNQKLNSMLMLLTEADCLTELRPEMVGQIKKSGGVRNYAIRFVEAMTESIRLSHIENYVSSYYTNDDEYQAQYGVTAYGFDSLNESSYLSHRYHWIRISNLIQMNNAENFDGTYETFLQEQGDFDLYSFFLSPNSSIKYPIFGVNQYRCIDCQNSEIDRATESMSRSMRDLNLSTEMTKPRPKKKKHVRFLFQQSNEKTGSFSRG